MKIDFPEVNSLSLDAFTDLLGEVYEDSPWVATKSWEKRPFASLPELARALQETVWESAEGDQMNLIQAHPDLVGRAAREGTLTPASTREQAAAGLGALRREEIDQFATFNQLYREKFGFPFIICARENKKESILAAFPRRLTHSAEEEKRTALEEIGKIARFRLAEIFGETIP